MFRKLQRQISGSLRYKLLVLVLFPILVVTPATLGLAVYWHQQFSTDQLFRRVGTDLSVAHDVFARLQEDYVGELVSLANSYAFLTAFAEKDATRVQDQLAALLETTGFGFLHVTDLQGRWILDEGVSPGTSTKSSPLLQKAAIWGTPSVGVEIFSQSELRLESEALADQAALPLLATPYAVPTDRKAEDRGLVIRTLAPVRNLNGEIVALLDGGVLINRNFYLVDRIRDLVYGPGTLAEGSHGAVTVLLDDVRISTNVPLRAGERALGTRVSADVFQNVLQRGNTWVDRAFVVNDWYISAYEPVIDVLGRRVGMLYTGYLEAPYLKTFHRAMLSLGAMLALVMALGAFMAIRGAKAIFQPIEAMASVVRATQAGEERRIGTVSSRDEIGELARQFDSMLDLLSVRNYQIRRAAEQLESKVEERTQELRAKNDRLKETIDLLQQTKRQLVVAEKFAALGELTAGVAHEINNPTAVILGNIDLIRSELGEDISPVETEVDLIIEQAYRIQGIVENLLRYSRPTEFAGCMEEVEVRSAVEDALVLVKHELADRGASVEKQFGETTKVAMERRELQQVLVNLLINAAQALSNGGTVRLSTRDWDGRGVALRVEDNGVGIPRDCLDRIFDPFFTMKREKGTGLGLSVSYALIRRYGGDITVKSESGKGTVFEVFLPREPGLDEESVAARLNAPGARAAS